MPRGLRRASGVRLARKLYTTVFRRSGPEVSLALVEAAAARTLNRRYRQGEYAPDVLAFPLGRGGDVVLNRQAVATQATRFGWPVAFEFARLTLHGFLHLSGQTHTRRAERERMERRERRTLASLFPALCTRPTVKQFLSHP